MLTKMLSLTLICLLLNIAQAGVVIARGSDDPKPKDEEKVARKAAKIKKGIEELGVSRESKVKLKLRGGKKIKGYVNAIGEESFTVIDDSGTANVIDYRNVKKINGKNLHSAAWFAIGAGAAVGVLFLIVAIGLRNGS